MANLLVHGRDVAVVEHLDAVDLAVDVCGGEPVGHAPSVGEGGPVREAGPGPADLEPAEVQRRDAPAANRVRQAEITQEIMEVVAGAEGV